MRIRPYHYEACWPVDEGSARAIYAIGAPLSHTGGEGLLLSAVSEEYSGEQQAYEAARDGRSHRTGVAAERQNGQQDVGVDALQETRQCELGVKYFAQLTVNINRRACFAMFREPSTIWQHNTMR